MKAMFIVYSGCVLSHIFKKSSAVLWIMVAISEFYFMSSELYLVETCQQLQVVVHETVSST
jgi:hypothetical protein